MVLKLNLIRFLQIKFLNPMITRKPKLRRQRKIFRQQGKMPRPEQMNINVATWGRLLKRNLNFQKSIDNSGSSSATRQEPHTGGTGMTFERGFFKGRKLFVQRGSNWFQRPYSKLN